MCILKRFLLSTPSVSIPPTPIVTTWLSLFCKCFKKLKSLSPYDTHLQPFVTMYIRKKVFWKFSWVTLLEFINSTMHLLSTLAPLKSASESIRPQPWRSARQWHSCPSLCMGDLVTALVITLESDVHYVTTCVEFNCCWQCLQRVYSIIWHWNEHSLCSHKSRETEQQGANLILVQQILVIRRKVVILYFLAMQQSSAL